MYIPSTFRVDSPDRLAAFIREHSFATIITHDGRSSFASHLPVLFHPETGPHGMLTGHMARANPQWQHFAGGQEALVIFHGPHAYISPSWYQTALAVPTWNYAVVHAYGIPQIIGDPSRLLALLEETVDTYEAPRPSPWSGALPTEFRDKLIQAIVGFEIPVTRFDGKFKLGQNRPEVDITGVYDALSSSRKQSDRAVAEMMLAECPGLNAKGDRSDQD